MSGNTTACVNPLYPIEELNLYQTYRNASINDSESTLNYLRPFTPRPIVRLNVLMLVWNITYGPSSTIYRTIGLNSFPVLNSQLITLPRLPLLPRLSWLIRVRILASASNHLNLCLQTLQHNLEPSWSILTTLSRRWKRLPSIYITRCL